VSAAVPIQHGRALQISEHLSIQMHTVWAVLNSFVTAGHSASISKISSRP